VAIPNGGILVKGRGASLKSCAPEGSWEELHVLLVVGVSSSLSNCAAAEAAQQVPREVCF
jgi:hypothetical protein